MSIYLQLFISFFKLGLLMFGGGYAMLPLLEHEIVDKKGWINNEELLDMYALAQCTPGGIAVNTATKTGYKIKGVLGAVCSTVGVVMPSLIIVVIISTVLESFAAIKEVQSVLSGIRVAACAMMVVTLIKLGKAGIKDWIGAAIFAAVFAASVFFGVSPVWLVLAAIFAGIFSGRSKEKRGENRE